MARDARQGERRLLREPSRRRRYETIERVTGRGVVTMRLYTSARARAGVVVVGGVGGGFDSPADALYPYLGKLLPSLGAAVLRVKFRVPRSPADCVADVAEGVALLKERGFSRLAIIGHSTGGAVAVQAAADLPEVVTVVTLATQSLGAHDAARIAPRSILLLHGEQDSVLPPSASLAVYRLANGPKDYELLPGAGHNLDEVADAVRFRVVAWLVEELGLDAPEELAPPAIVQQPTP